MNENPWVTHSQLTEERLVFVGKLLTNARREVAMLYEPDKGDRPWDRGCRAYSRCKFAIRESAKRHPWLVPITDESSLEFTFKIDGVPIRFCKAIGEDIPSKYLERLPEEQGWLPLQFDKPVEVILRMVIHTQPNGEAARIVLTEITEGVVTGEYAIPELVAGTKRLNQPKRAPVVLPPASFGLKDEKNQKGQTGS